MGVLVNVHAMRRAIGATVALVVVGAPATVVAQGVAPAWRLTAGTTVQFDDNLFRLPDGVAPAELGLAPGGRSDRIVQPTLEFEGRMRWGRQTLRGSAAYRDQRLRTWDRYDSDNLDGSLTWDWQLGNHWSGEIGAAQREETTSFADFIGTQRNVLRIDERRLRMNWRPRPDRRLTAVLTEYDGENSAPALRANDYTVRAVRFEAAVTGAPGDDVVLGIRHTDGRYPNREIDALVPIDSSYTQEEGDLGFAYTRGAWRLDARAGVARRRYEAVSARDFTGPTGLVRWTWRPTGKTSAELSWSRDLGAVDEYDDLFTVSQVGQASLRWEATARVALTALWKRRDIDYRGDPRNVLIDLIGPRPAREDTIDDTSIGVAWTVFDRVALTVQRAWSRRASTRESLDYRANVWSAGVRVTWD